MHRTPDDLLDALDPEQRQVAEALRGPVRVLAGAGTGKTRAITHRIAYGVATGVYAPTEVLAVTFTTRAAGEMRARLRQLGAAGVQARTFHSAALRQLRYFWPHVYGTELPDADRVQARAAGHRRAPAAGSTPTRRCCATWPPRSSGPRSATSAPTTTPRLAARPRPLGRRPRPGDRRPALRRLRGGQARPGPDGHGGRAAPHRRACSPRTSGSPRRCAGSTNGSSSTSSRTSRRSSRRCSTCGSAAATSCAWSATRRRRSTRSPAPTPTTCATSRRSTPAPPRSSWSATTARRPQVVDGRQHPARRLRRARASSCAPSGRPARRSRYAGHPDEVAEAAAVADRIADAAPTPAGRLGEIAVLFRINAQSEAFEEALADRGIPYVVRGAARFFDRPEVRQAVTLLRGAARSGEAAGRPASRRCARSWPAWAGRASRPTARGQTRDRWESWQALVDQADGVRAGRTAPTWRVRRRPRPARRRAARAGRRRRHARDVPRRQGPGVGLRVPRAGSRTAPCRSPTPRRRPRSRRSAGCSTSA